MFSVVYCEINFFCDKNNMQTSLRDFVSSRNASFVEGLVTLGFLRRQKAGHSSILAFENCSVKNSKKNGLHIGLPCFVCFHRLQDLQARDDAKVANERAKNLLESHIYDMHEKLSSEEGVLLSTEEEREKINQALSEASEWLDDEGWDLTADVSQTLFCCCCCLIISGICFRIKLLGH